MRYERDWVDRDRDDRGYQTQQQPRGYDEGYPQRQQQRGGYDRPRSEEGKNRGDTFASDGKVAIQEGIALKKEFQQEVGYCKFSGGIYHY